MQEIAWFKTFMGLLGGVALFLYGMEMMSGGMKKFAGQKMRSVLSMVTKNRVVGLVTGAFVTMVIQSSSATTVMLVSFVQAGLLTFTQTLGVILGADIGTTITAQLVAFKLTDYALLMIAIGFAIKMFSKNEKYKHLADAVLGFGILFFGMKIMGGSMKPFRTYEPFIEVIKTLSNPLLGILIGAIFTAIIQSSSAFTGIVIVLAQQKLVTLEIGIPLIMGANIGTCITAGLASIGTDRAAKRVAMAHVLFKIVGVIVVLPVLGYFIELINYIAIKSNVGVPRQIAHAHTIFNVTLGVVALPFVRQFSKLIMKILPEKIEVISDEEKKLLPFIKNLDESLISVPSVAIDLARAEIFQMIKLMEKMVNYALVPFMNKTIPMDKKYPQIDIIKGFEVREEKIDYIESKVSDYLLRVSQQKITDEETDQIFNLLSIMNDIESIADIIEKRLIPLIAKKSAINSHFSPEGQKEIEEYHLKVCKQINRVRHAFKNLDAQKGKHMLDKMEEYIELEASYRLKHLQRFSQNREESVETHEIHMELMDLFKQINLYTGEIAKNIAQISVGKKAYKGDKKQAQASITD